MASRIQLQTALQKPYDRILFSKEVLSPVFGSCLHLSTSAVPASVQPNKSEQTVIKSVSIYGNIHLEDGTEITCYEINLQPSVRIEHSRVAIQRYVRKLLTAGQIAFVNFIAPQNKKVWRLTLVAKDSELTEQGIKEKSTNSKRYTYLLGPSETCKTAAERFESLSTEKEITFKALVNAFSVEKLSKAFFDEYTLHYQKFCDYLQDSNFRKSVFNISIPPNSSKEEKDKACKPIRDFVKKLLGRIVFLYFVQKKGWLGASDTNYKDGLTDFIKQLFQQSGGNDSFYSTWLTVLFFETLNKERSNDDFKMPDGKKVKVPFLNGGLFDKEDHDRHMLTFKSKLFHRPDFEDTLLTEKNKNNARGFLDFLDAFNFTVYEDSPEDQTVAVDPEMLGHIFENLLEDNKDKGAFYTPKEIVHYMCQESLTEYLTTHLSKAYTVYKEIGKAQVELFGNETKTGQLKIMEALGDKALNRDDVAYMVKHKDISNLTKAQLKKIDSLLDTVKICDPAIGSGAFPMGLLQEIHALKEVIAYELQQPWKPAEVKENIIQNSVYGVDIEKGAVDIARLRFWLSLVVDEEKPRALPNLDYKIMQGNSLLESYEDIDLCVKITEEKELFRDENKFSIADINELKNLVKGYYKAGNSKLKKKLQGSIENIVNKFITERINEKSKLNDDAIAETETKLALANKQKPTTTADTRKKSEALRKIKATLHRLLKERQIFDELKSQLKQIQKTEVNPFFLWHLWFSSIFNQGGFDIVIGNPPYINVENLDTKFRKHLFEKFETCKGRTDIYVAFIENALKLFKPNGVLCFIIPYAYTKQAYGTLSRKLLIEKYHIKEILDTSNYLVFESANVKNVILTIKNERTKSLTEIKKANTSLDFKENNFQTHKLPQVEFLALKDCRFETNDVSESMNVKKNIWANSIPFSDICLVAYGARLNHKSRDIGKEHYISIENQNGYKKFTEGKNINRYNFTQYGWLNYQPKEHYNSMFPELFENDKIMFINIVKERLRFAFDSEHFYNSHTVINCVKWNLLQDAKHTTVKRNITDKKIKVASAYSNYFLLSILNSNLINWYFKNFLSESLHFYPDDAKSLPVAITNMKNQEPFSNFVSYVLFLKTQTLTNVTDQFMPTYFEQIIDGMVYELYFPELIKKHKREVVQHLGELPELKDNMSDEQKMKICKTVFNRLNQREHPVRVNLFYMDSIPEIAIIEGKAEKN